MKVFFRLLILLLSFRWWIALAILLGCLTVASNIGLLSMAAYLIAEAALIPLLALLTLPIFFVRLMAVARPASRYYERLLSHNIAFRLLAQLRIRVYNRLAFLAPAHLLNFRSGDLLTRLVADIDELQNFYLRAVAPIIVAIVVSLLTFNLFQIFSSPLAWTAFFFLAGTGLGVPLLIGLLMRGLGKRQLALRAEQKAQVVDGIQGLQDILAFDYSANQQRKISVLDQALGELQGRMAHITGLQDGLLDLLTHLALWATLLLAIPLVASRTIDGVYLGFLSLLILASFEATQPLAQAFQTLGHSLAAGKRMFAITDASPLVEEDFAPLRLKRPSQSKADFKGLQFEHVDFAYASQPVLQDICLHLAPGKRVAVVGPSGAGKSTLARLALRCWDPSHGSILLNGHDLSLYALDDLRGLMGVVTQDTYLFNDTLRRNLLLARPDASKHDLEQALEQAQLLAFVRQLPHGLDTWIGEQGVRLSGGERQRLAIARALLKDAPLLLLDEVTANLDPLTESDVLHTLFELMARRSTLLITHRLIGMERMDEIIVLDQGRIIQRGTHEQLLSTDGLYRQLFDLQSQILTFQEVL